MTARELATKLLALPDPDVRVFLEARGSALGSHLVEVAGTLADLAPGARAGNGDPLDGTVLILTTERRALDLRGL